MLEILYKKVFYLNFSIFIIIFVFCKNLCFVKITQYLYIWFFRELYKCLLNKKKCVCLTGKIWFKKTKGGVRVDEGKEMVYGNICVDNFDLFK